MAENTTPLVPTSSAAAPTLIVLAGATSDLGFRLAQALLVRGAVVRALVRPGNTTPRYLPVVGGVATMRDLQAAASAATGQRFGRLRVGGLWLLKLLIKVMRPLLPAANEVFPPWQGMQYLHNMFTSLYL